MSRIKRKTPPQNFLSHFWDEYILFRYDFVIETSASIEDCIKSIEEISQRQRGWWNRKLETTITPLKEKQHFMIIAEKTIERFNQEEQEGAKLEGIIERDDGITTVHGSVTLGWQKWLFGVIGLGGFLIFSLLTNSNNPNCYFVLLAGCVLITFFETYGARRYLIQQLQAAIREAETDTQKLTLKSKREQHNTIVPDDTTQEQSARNAKR